MAARPHSRSSTQSTSIPDSFAHFKKTGEFRDGTVLVKDLVGVGTKEAPSGKGYFMGDFNGMDVSIKDSKRFKDEPGKWGYFTFGHKPPAQEGGRHEQQSCRVQRACHQNNATLDWVFTKYSSRPSRMLLRSVEVRARRARGRASYGRAFVPLF